MHGATIKVQLHVSALDNGHLQVVNGILIKQLYKTYMGCIHGAGRRGGGYEVEGYGYLGGLCYYRS